MDISILENTSDVISRQAAIDALDCISGVEEVLKSLPSAQSELADKIRAIGYTGKEGRIYIGGRLFAVRELPQ
jgi:hypothetical protein